MTTHAKDHIRSLFTNLEYHHNLLKIYLPKAKTTEERNHMIDLYNEWVRTDRKQIHDFYEHHTDPLKDSLLTGARRRVSNGDDMCNAYTEFWIDPDTSMSDEDAREICEDERIDFSSPYDCTGYLFTSRISYNRTPAGVAFVHVLHYDY